MNACNWKIGMLLTNSKTPPSKGQSPWAPRNWKVGNALTNSNGSFGVRLHRMRQAQPDLHRTACGLAVRKTQTTTANYPRTCLTSPAAVLQKRSSICEGLNDNRRAARRIARSCS